MCATVAWLFESLANWRWPEILTAAGTVALAVFAYRALAAWKGQERAKRETDFLSDLVDAVHSFIAEMSKPITLAKFVKIGMDSHAPPGDLEGCEVGAIAYIQKRGAEDSRRLVSVLDAIQPTTIRLQSLIAKGQVFKFDGYSKCFNAVRMLAWHFGRLEVLAAIIGNGNLNWDNPEVAKQLRNAMDIAADEDFDKKLAEENVIVLTFFVEAYERIYGKRP